MKIPAFIFLGILLFACGNKSLKSSTETKPQEITEVLFQEEIHDFGVLKAGEIVLYNFEISNVGEKHLHIKNVSSDCGCVHTKFSEEPILPGKSGLIEVEFDSSGLFGRQYKTIEINANCKEPKHLVIFAQVENEILDIKY